MGIIIGLLLVGGAVFGTFYWDSRGQPTMKPWKAVLLAVVALAIGVALFAGYWEGPIP